MEEFQAKVMLHDAVLKTLIQYLGSRGKLDMDDFLKVFDALVIGPCSLDPTVLEKAKSFRAALVLPPQDESD